jgi:hypothetical protein
MSGSATFIVTVEWTRESGKFVARDEIVDVIRSELEDIQPDLSSLGQSGDSEYACEVRVEEQPEPPRIRRRKGMPKS